MDSLEEKPKQLKPRHSLVLLREMFASDRAGHLWTASELSELMPMSKSTLYRAVNELITHGFIVRVSRGVYSFLPMDNGSVLPLDMERVYVS